MSRNFGSNAAIVARLTYTRGDCVVLIARELEVRQAEGVMLGENRGKAIGAYVGATAICLLILVWVMRLWRADLAVPFAYQGDALGISALIKGLLDNGWYLHNRFVGMPTGLDFHDYPIAESFQLLVMKLLSFWFSDYAVVLNVYFLMTFPLTVFTSLCVFRGFNLSFPPAIVGSLLFAFLPYHFFRGEGHLFLASYYLIPPMVMIILWVCLDQPMFGVAKDAQHTLSKRPGSKAIAGVAICLVVASAGIYYAFFSGFFLLVSGVFASFQRRCHRPLLAAGILSVVLVLGLLANLSPSIIYAYQHGRNPAAVIRSPAAAEIYGMRIIQLLLPVSGHRIPYLAGVKHAYNRSTPLVNENDAVTLGAVGSCGFLMLLGWLMFRRPEVGHTGLLSSLAVLNISAVLLATIGGFGSLFASAVSAEIRAYNRISVYIAFFSIFVVVALLDDLAQRWATSRIRRCLYSTLLGLILLGGLLDQTTAHFVPPYERLKAEYLNDADFVRRIEASVPGDAMIFQLPYVPFPEYPPVHHMTDYSLFRGYLHSRTLRWSYGAMKGRDGDSWQRQVVEKPLSEQIETLAAAGFRGIYVDRYGYADQAAELEAKLSVLAGTKPIEAANQRLVFFSLATGFTSGEPSADQ